MCPGGVGSGLGPQPSAHAGKSCRVGKLFRRVGNVVRRVGNLLRRAGLESWAEIVPCLGFLGLSGVTAGVGAQHGGHLFHGKVAAAVAEDWSIRSAG